MKKYKCRICKIYIQSDIIEESYISKSKKEIIKRFHKDCYYKNQKNKKEKDNFYKYIKENFFKIAIPKHFFIGMSEINCNFKDILECCNEIQLISIIDKKNFINDRAKSSYMLEVIKSNINTYMNKKEDNMDFDIDNELLDRKKYVYENQINYDEW